MDKHCEVARFIENRIRILGKQQTEIAAECGFEKPNMITMIKQGRTKLPLAKVGPMAKALEADPVQLLKLTMKEYMPETWAAIEPHLDEALTADELRMIRAMRNFVGGPYIAALTDESRKLLDQFMLSLRTPAARH